MHLCRDCEKEVEDRLRTHGIATRTVRAGDDEFEPRLVVRQALEAYVCGVHGGLMQFGLSCPLCLLRPMNEGLTALRNIVGHMTIRSAGPGLRH